MSTRAIHILEAVLGGWNTQDSLTPQEFQHLREYILAWILHKKATLKPGELYIDTSDWFVLDKSLNSFKFIQRARIEFGPPKGSLKDTSHRSYSLLGGGYASDTDGKIRMFLDSSLPVGEMNTPQIQAAIELLIGAIRHELTHRGQFAPRPAGSITYSPSNMFSSEKAEREKARANDHTLARSKRMPHQLQGTARSWYYGLPEEIMAYAVELSHYMGMQLRGESYPHLDDLIQKRAIELKKQYAHRYKFTDDVYYEPQPDPEAYKLFKKYLFQHLVQHEKIPAKTAGKAINALLGSFIHSEYR